MPYCCRFVDVGDQGVNDARWFHNDSILVTASGNGRYRKVILF